MCSTYILNHRHTCTKLTMVTSQGFHHRWLISLASHRAWIKGWYKQTQSKNHTMTTRLWGTVKTYLIASISLKWDMPTGLQPPSITLLFWWKEWGTVSHSLSIEWDATVTDGFVTAGFLLEGTWNFTELAKIQPQPCWYVWSSKAHASSFYSASGVLLAWHNIIRTA